MLSTARSRVSCAARCLRATVQLTLPPLAATPNGYFYTATAYSFASGERVRLYLPPLPGAIVDSVNQADPSLRSKGLRHSLSGLSAMLALVSKQAPRVDASFRVVWVWEEGIVWVYRSTVPGDARLLVPGDELRDRASWDLLAGFTCVLIEAQAQSASGSQRGVWQGLATLVDATVDGQLYMTPTRTWLETEDGRATMADAQFNGPLMLQTAGGALVKSVRLAFHGEQAVAQWEVVEEALGLGL